MPRASNSKLVCSGDRYIRIKEALSEPSTLVYLNFTAFVASSLTPFLKLFQKSEPLVHILFEKLIELVRTMMLKFMKADVLGTKEGQELININCDDTNSWLTSKGIEVGTGTNKALTAVDKDEEKRR